MQKHIGKVKTLNNLSAAYLSSSPEQSYKFANNALKLARKTNNKQEIANSLDRIGIVYYRMEI